VKTVDSLPSSYEGAYLTERAFITNFEMIAYGLWAYITAWGSERVDQSILLALSENLFCDTVPFVWQCCSFVPDGTGK